MELRAKANVGDGMAMAALGYVLTNEPKPTKQEMDEGILWLRKAADKNSAYALEWLGVIYGSEEKGYWDPKTAVECWTKSRDLGMVWAARDLGRFYATKAKPIDLRKAFINYEMAAQKGELDSILYIAGAYLRGGEGVDKNQAYGITLLNRILDDPRAKIELAKCYLNGIGVKKNIDLSKKMLGEVASDKDNIYSKDAASLLLKIK